MCISSPQEFIENTHEHKIYKEVRDRSDRTSRHTRKVVTGCYPGECVPPWIGNGNTQRLPMEQCYLLAVYIEQLASLLSSIR